MSSGLHNHYSELFTQITCTSIELTAHISLSVSKWKITNANSLKIVATTKSPSGTEVSI